MCANSRKMRFGHNVFLKIQQTSVFTVTCTVSRSASLLYFCSIARNFDIPLRNEQTANYATKPFAIMMLPRVVRPVSSSSRLRQKHRRFARTGCLQINTQSPYLQCAQIVGPHKITLRMVKQAFCRNIHSEQVFDANARHRSETQNLWQIHLPDRASPALLHRPRGMGLCAACTRMNTKQLYARIFC